MAKRTKAEIKAFREGWRQNNERLLELAKKAQADLDRRKQTER
ncbi:MAG TPA: hypothetical protein VE984_10015 [Gaiellaceae bacterium]|nr:hypothetical protein [Gaiellaceae bacterium]